MQVLVLDDMGIRH